MENNIYLNARKWIKILASPIAMIIIIVLWFTVFMDEEKFLLSLFIIGGISLIFFYFSYYVLSPHSIKSGSLKRMIIATIFFSTLYTIVHLFIFGFQIVKLPYPFNTSDYPISFYISLLYIIALTLYLAGLSLHLVINQLSISYESLSLLKNSYENEIEALKLQMNPHFIANSLNNLSTLIYDKDSHKSMSYISELIGLVGKQVNSSSAVSIPIVEEIQWIESYLKMEKSRVQFPFDYKIIYDSKIDYNTSVPPMLIQPIIENSIIHGFDSTLFDKNALLEIAIKKRRFNGIVIEIKDNGLGIKAKKIGDKRNRKSISTENIAKRIKLINEMGDFYIRKISKIDQNGAVIVIYIEPPLV